MSKPSVRKNEFKGTLIDFKKIKVLTDKDNFSMQTNSTNYPVLALTKIQI